MRTRMSGGVTGKAGDSLPMSILKQTIQEPRWTTRLFWRSSVSAAAKVKILCNIGVYLETVRAVLSEVPTRRDA